MPSIPIDIDGIILTYGMLNIILLISRDAIHFLVVCRYTHRPVAYLYLTDTNQMVRRGLIFNLRINPRYYNLVDKPLVSLCTSFGNNVVFI